MLTPIQYVALLSLAIVIFYTVALLAYIVHKGKETDFRDTFQTTVGFYAIVIILNGIIICSLAKNSGAL